jgi:hypothetical protein
MGKCFMPDALALPMVWRESEYHSSDCYFCLTNITEITSNSKHTVKYQDLISVLRSVHTVNGCLYQSLQKILYVVMKTLILIKIMDSKKGTMFIANRHLKQVGLHLNPIY